MSRNGDLGLMASDDVGPDGDDVDGDAPQPVPRSKKAWIQFNESDANVAQPSDPLTQSALERSRSKTPETLATDDTVAILTPSESVQLTNTVDGTKERQSKSSSPATSSAILPPPPVNVTPMRNGISLRPTELDLKSAITASNNKCNNNANQMQSIALKTIDETVVNVASNSTPMSFKNGDVIVKVVPQNSHCAWVTPASFKPELVPEELMSQNLSLTVEDYVTSMQQLVNDLRFNLYVILYKRILSIWIALGFVILISLLFSGAKGLALFGGGILWLIINAMGIFLSMWIKIKLYHLLERCIQDVNQNLFRCNILLGIDDQGKISCHKVNLVFVYFDVTYCIKYLKDMLENEERMSEGRTPQVQPSLPSISMSGLGIDTDDIIITGSNSRRIPQKEKFAERLLLRYSQRWIKAFIRQRVGFNVPIHGDASIESPSFTPLSPRHCPTARCPCQYIEEHLRFKPLNKCSILDLCL